MGEIGINWHDYLYRLSFCQILLISRGYRARHHAGWEQARLVAYHARYCMGSKEPPPTVSEWIRFPWEHDMPDITQEDIDAMREEIKNFKW